MRNLSYVEGPPWRRITFVLHKDRIQIEKRNAFGRICATQSVILTTLKLPKRLVFIRTDRMRALFGLPGLVGISIAAVCGEGLYSDSVVYFWVLVCASVIALFVGFSFAKRTKCFVWEPIDKNIGIALAASESGSSGQNLEAFATEIERAIERVSNRKI
jgi:hypothetical protein